ncbi:helix-turn-helix domain-containing protein [Nocardioides sp. LML1-1-1.1]|uniref:helix-turn-helix domain-containing protein n=1 Tax=Nocardioides sp. LML1-1-1.1 TaxID=3135248 RepID=UPI003448BF28
MDFDQGGRQLAGLILDAAGRGQHDQVADLIAPLDAEQLRSLVSVLAVQVDQSTPASSATGPAAVCELAINAAAPMFGTTPEAILSAERSRPVSDARAVAMTAARAAGLSFPAIAEHFNKDHGSVMHAVSRTAERPRLADAAARVSEHVNSRYAARVPRGEENVVPLHQQPPASTFQPEGPVEHAVVAAAEAFNTTPEVLLGADRSRTAADARAVAMTAARIHGHSLPTIARHFERDHTTVLSATRRIEKTPPLRDLAAKIAADLPEQAASAGADHLDIDEQIPESVHRSPGLREQQRAIPVSGERAQLRVAR